MSVLHILLVILMIAGGLIALFRSEWLIMLIGWMEDIIKSWGNWNYLILFLVAMIESFPFVGAAVPGMNVMILVGGFFVARQWDIFPYAALLAMIGACLGNALGYWMGRYSGMHMLQKYGLWFGAGPRELQWVDKQIQKNGFWFIVGGKFHNLFRSFVPYIAGAHGMSGKRFWTANIFGSCLWSTSILLVGIFFIERYETVLKNFNYIFLGIIIIIVLIAWYKTRKGAITKV